MTYLNLLKNSCYFKILFLVLFLFSSNSYANNLEQKVTIRADIWCPYNCKPNSKDPGLMIEVAYKAFGKENVDYQTMTWKKAIAETRKGKIDAIVGAAISDAPDFFLASALSRTKTCFYKKSSSTWLYDGSKSLKGLRMGFINSYGYPDPILAYAKENSKNKEFVRNDVLAQILKEIADDKLDIVPDDQNVLTYAVKTNPELQNRVRPAGCLLNPDDITSVSISFSPTNQERSLLLVKQLNATIKLMLESGEMQKLASKYNMKPWW